MGDRTRAGNAMGSAAATVAVIDDDEAARLSIGQMLRLRGYRVETFSSGEAALAWPGLPDASCILCDVKMPGMSGEEFLAETARRPGFPPIVIITGHGDVSMAVRCLKAGAYDFVEKPFDDEVLLACVARAVERTAMRRESEDIRRRLRMLDPCEDGRFGMVGRSPAMLDLYSQIEAVSRSGAPVIIVGETGSGKELAARAIHSQSPRRDGPFVPVNVGALPESTVESELFGHARGAFTGADSDRDGRIAAASGGTLLLDEIESISDRVQRQLLRILEDGLVYPLGKDQPRKVDIRLLTTAKTDLREQVKRGQIREDFYHRIAVLHVFVPPLRERIEDMPLLVSYFLRLAAARDNVPPPKVPAHVLEEMLRYPWPGNIRELRNVVERMVVTACSGEAGPFSPEETQAASRLLSLPASQGRLREALEKTERAIIETTLAENNGEIFATAVALGISRRALYERMKKYGISKEDFKP
ncbi:MAG: sigma-54 dependent transcriptional regulator [Planctomycetota bacterium]|nr:sigma-54 dependent transcriptional regulator [Planctomycetota bacterium]